MKNIKLAKIPSFVMKIKLPSFLAITFGLLHFMVVGIPFLVAGGGGEGLLYIGLIHLPLFIIGEFAFKALFYNSLVFNFILFIVIGTLMYSFLGYMLGLLVRRVTFKEKI